MNKNLEKHQLTVRSIVFMWLAILAVVVIYYICISIFRIGKIGTTTKCAPYSASVYIDDVKVANNAVNFIKEGEHTVTCFLEGFSIETEQINIDENNQDVLIALLPITSEGQKVYEKTLNDYDDVEKYSGKAFFNDAKLSEDEKKLYTFLPYNTDSFGLGTFKENDGTITITMTLWKSRYTQMAINKLIDLAKEAKVSIAEYDFRINGFTSQLAEFKDNSESDIESYIRNGYRQLDMEIRGAGTINDYAYLLIAVRQLSGDNVIYRAVFKEKEGVMRLVSSPYPILTVQNTPDVPKETLDYINNLAQTMTDNT